MISWVTTNARVNLFFFNKTTMYYGKIKRKRTIYVIPTYLITTDDAQK